MADTDDQKIYMLNALWFKADGGAEKYAAYGAAAAPFVAKYGGRALAGYRPIQAFIGEFDPDLFFIVEWPNAESFQKLPVDPGYLAIAHLREEALDKSLLIQCAALPPIVAGANEG